MQHAGTAAERYACDTVGTHLQCPILRRLKLCQVRQLSRLGFLLRSTPLLCQLQGRQAGGEDAKSGGARSAQRCSDGPTHLS